MVKKNDHVIVKNTGRTGRVSSISARGDFVRVKMSRNYSPLYRMNEIERDMTQPRAEEMEKFLTGDWIGFTFTVNNDKVEITDVVYEGRESYWYDKNHTQTRFTVRVLLEKLSEVMIKRIKEYEK